MSAALELRQQRDVDVMTSRDTGRNYADISSATSFDGTVPTQQRRRSHSDHHQQQQQFDDQQLLHQQLLGLHKIQYASNTTLTTTI